MEMCQTKDNVDVQIVMQIMLHICMINDCLSIEQRMKGFIRCVIDACPSSSNY